MEGDPYVPAPASEHVLNLIASTGLFSFRNANKRKIGGDRERVKRGRHIPTAIDKTNTSDKKDRYIFAILCILDIESLLLSLVDVP